MMEYDSLESAVNEIGRLEIVVEDKDDVISDLEDKMEALQGGMTVEISCKRCDRPFRGGSVNDYCSRDCELGYVGWPYQTRPLAKAQASGQ